MLIRLIYNFNDKMEDVCHFIYLYKMDTSTEIKEMLNHLGDESKSVSVSKYFKCKKGEYGEGDVFIGVTIPEQRKIVNLYWEKIDLADLSKILSSKIHEYRHTALLILVKKYERSKNIDERKAIVDFYLKHLKFINNWDLVDNSCYKILGNYCFEINNENILHQLSKSENLWKKRIAIVATMYFVKKGKFELTKKLVLNNLSHSHDLMHKANGWLLREVGKKNEEELIQFLDHHYQKMPRTTLRYAIEKFEEPMRQDYLKGRR